MTLHVVLAVGHPHAVWPAGAARGSASSLSVVLAIFHSRLVESTYTQHVYNT